ncbi:hypothetical protein [Roseofilum sp. Belize Diploria]|uniref:hypothetical protein n=1 Tax=Roseofilum sp. Belize Diploria TaxID=2821501 RepID=UPI001B19D9BE|nr:hypothetical protein [Roseofilum sp. Belize Diploria]MBP0009254.1 hypothetical protein [Roseofilum sp. Belize Diploria]
MQNLPKQTQPVIRNLNITAAWLQCSGIDSSNYESCYKLKGLARNICMAAF